MTLSRRVSKLEQSAPSNTPSAGPLPVFLASLDEGSTWVFADDCSPCPEGWKPEPGAMVIEITSPQAKEVKNSDHRAKISED